MSRTAVEELKAIRLLAAETTIATVTGSAVDVEVYESDAIVVADVGNGNGANSVVTITVTGSLVATPNTYDQTLATFTATTAAGGNFGAGAQRIKLEGIKNIKGVATLGATSQVAVSITALVRPLARGSTVNSATLA